MTRTSQAPFLVVLQLTGGNDYLNTVIPYTNPLYRDYRPVVGIPEDTVLPLDDTAAFHPAMGPMKPLYERGDMAIIHGVGSPNAPRSHFRSMDIWHTCEPNKLGTEGWLGRATREIDPHKENVLTTVSFGPSLFRALVLPGVPVACVDNLDTYGLLPGVSEQRQRARILQWFAHMYSPAVGSGAVMHYKLWKDVSEGVACFFDDLQEHGVGDNVIMLMFSEFGRRTRDNGSGTDHGSGGVAFVLGERVKGGQYSEFPSMRSEDLEQGDVVPNHDFRGLYSTILEDWMGLDAKPLVGGTFEKLAYLQ